MSWADNRMVAFDLETTDKDPEQARVVSACVAYVGGGELTVSEAKLVNPGVPIPDEAREVHGISDEQVQADGIEPGEAMRWIQEAFWAAVQNNWAVVIFNARYDLTAADREMRRCGLASDALWARLKIVDPMVIDRHVDRYRAGKRRLTEACEVYNVRLDMAHDAAFDAIAAARLAWRIGKAGQIVRRQPRSHTEAREQYELRKEWAQVRENLHGLHDAQRMWAFDQAVDLERYFHEGNPKKDVPPQPDRKVPREWPLIPVPGPQATDGVADVAATPTTTEVV